MGRTSLHSKKHPQTYPIGPRVKTAARKGDLPEQLLETKLRSEQAKLSLLEAQLPDNDAAQYTRYVDMPPPTPEDEAMFEAEFAEIMESILSEPIGPEAGESLQDWLRGQGAVIPDTPEWKTPLYLDKWVCTASDPS